MIKISYDIKKYRKDISEIVGKNTTIIELGCHIGGTTKLLPKSSQIIAVDNSPEAICEMNKFDNVNFISGDVRLHEVIAEVFQITQK